MNVIIQKAREINAITNIKETLNEATFSLIHLMSTTTSYLYDSLIIK